MKIALLAPPYLPVPPVAYGGTEKIVSLLSDGLVEKGHDVTLFASGDSVSKAKIIYIFPKSLGNSGLTKNDAVYPLLHFRECFTRASDFDIIHNHAQYLPMFLSEYCKTPVVHTIHGSYYEGEIDKAKRYVLEKHKNEKIISISLNQRQGMPDLNFVANVYNALNIKEYTFIKKPQGDYLLWVGRIVKKKGPTIAIEVAKRVKMPLVIAAAVDPLDKPYFDKEVKPLIDGKQVNFIGELTPQTLDGLYGNAFCTLFPVLWHEPFGLVMIESMVCGTPVVGYGNGAVPEVIEDGKTGFIINSESGSSDLKTAIKTIGVDGLVEAVERIKSLPDKYYQAMRERCRHRVEEHFSTERMVSDYEKAYKLVLESSKNK